LDRWEAKGRPGARKTFASIEDYFASKNPAGYFQLLDFGTTLLGRDSEFAALNEFIADAGKRAAIVSGRGGIGKSKLLHDWAKHHFLLLSSAARFKDSEPSLLVIVCSSSDSA
jgi:hypothetical protein